MIYKVTATEFLPLRERALHDQDEDRYLSLLKDLIKSSPLYFSYSFDLTNSFQRQSESDHSLAPWARADDRFFWNRFIQSDLIDLRLGKNTRFGKQRPLPAVDPFILPVMFGMLEIRNTSVLGTPLTFILTSRRSRFRAGTRYFSRGIDEEGHVSNFNETEQTIILNDDASKGPVSYEGDAGLQDDKLRKAVGKEGQVLSYVQTRGSVPVYWAEVNDLNYSPKLQVRGVESAQKAAQRHFNEQVRIYGDNWLVNLVKQSGRETRIKEAYEQMVRILVSDPTEAVESDNVTPEKFNVIEPSRGGDGFNRLHYVYFDFHNETKGLQWHRAKVLMQKLEEPIVHHGYFRAVDMPGDSYGRVEVRNKQSATVRTNCMDCLDRTNIVQSMLGRVVLSRMLADLGIIHEHQSVEDDLKFEHLFRNVWADNADVVSKSYSGTGALKTDVTRTGERTKRGMMMDLNSAITRYVKNNFLDGPRQDAFDVFLGTYRPATNQVGLGSIFADTRPLAVQGVPYAFAACILLLSVGSFTKRDENAAVVWPLRLVMIISFISALACFFFIRSNGMLFVSVILKV
jgi:hypothetical protein